MITGFAHICLLSADLARTERFYVDVLGMTKKFDFLRGASKIGFYLEAAPNQFIEVFQKSDRELPQSSAITHFCLQVNDIQLASKQLHNHQVDHQRPKLGADNSWQMWCKDPDGIAIEFHQYTPKSSQYTGVDCQVNW